DQRGAAERGLSALPASDPVDVDRGAASRSRTGQVDDLPAGGTRSAALLEARGRHAVQVPHVLRHDPVASDGSGGTVALARPVATPGHGSDGGGGAAPRARVPPRRELREARAQPAAPSSEW